MAHLVRYDLPAVVLPICSMYGIFAYIWVILFGQMLVNIPDMEHKCMDNHNF